MHHVSSPSDVYLANHSVNSTKLLWRFAKNVPKISELIDPPSPRTMIKNLYDCNAQDFQTSIDFSQEFLMSTISNMDTIHGKLFITEK